MSQVPEAPAASPEVRPRAALDTGVVLGTREDGIDVFRGIPYAAPPVGPLRWRPPQPAAHWTGEREAYRFGPMCLQPPNPRDHGVGTGPASEDCLTLNVWAPVQRRDGPLPVMVWVHGGGFTGGTSSAPLYDGRALARRGVVLVTVNYRLGHFGFFAHPALSRSSGSEPLANYGLMDLIAALRWVQRHAAAFGGDARQVTLFGQSAGGVAVQHLMVAPDARGLFARAIVQSGRGLEVPMRLAAAEARGLALSLGAESPGLVPPDSAVLRALPAERIAAWPAPMMHEGFGPVLDGRIVPMPVWEAFVRGQQARVPVVIGFNEVELPGAFLGDTGRLEASFGWSGSVRAAVHAAYGGEAGFRERGLGDQIYAVPALRIAQAHAAHAPTYAYRFAFVAPFMRGRMPGAPHSSERPYVFGNLAASPWPIHSDEDRAMADLMGALWVDFAREGRPAAATVWPPLPAAAGVAGRGGVFDIAGPQPRMRPFDEIAPPLAVVHGTHREEPRP